MSRRRTVARPAGVSGVGLFTGVAVELVFRPAAAGAGIGFRRVDVADAPTVAAHVRNLVEDPRMLGLELPSPARNTVLADGACVVATTEHVLSALVGMGITDVIVELNAVETPVGDGSAGAFVQALADAGSQELAGQGAALVVDREVTVEGKAGERIVARPAPVARYVYQLEYAPGGPIPAQSADWSINEEYARRVGPARTFCLEAEARAMRAAGLFAHLSPRDMLVIGADGPIDNALRFSDEPARHKLLDLIGDLALVGRPILGEVVATRSGHALNHRMARALAAL